MAHYMWKAFVLFLLFLWCTITSIPEMIYGVIRWIFPKEKDLRGKHVLVTGSARGLGKGMALMFARLGSIVLCVDIDEKSNEDTCREINHLMNNKRSAWAFTCDVSDPKAIKKLKDRILKEFGHVDILVNNAGIIYGRPILEEDQTMAVRVIDVNLMSSYWMVRSFLPHMKEKNAGHIVFINSIASLSVLGDAVIYTVAKSGLLGLTLSVADEFSRDRSCKNIKLSSVHPYFIATDGLKADPRGNRIRAMKVDTAAEQIVTGIRREYTNFTVPGFELGYWFLCFSRVVPDVIIRKITNTLHKDIMKSSEYFG